MKPGPLYDVLKAKGAVYEEVYGFERPRWIDRDGVEQRDHFSFRRNKVHDMVGTEVFAVRKAVGIMDVTITAISDDWAALSLNGPRARHVLRRCTDADLSNSGFCWLSAKEIVVAGHKLWAFRMSYAGELDWETHMPNAACVDVYNALWSAGERDGITDYGSFAMNALRMEKGFPGAGEFTNEVTLAEAGVMRFVKLDKDFLGAESSRISPAAAVAGMLPWTCTYLEIEPDGDVDGHGGEAVLLNGKVVGSTSSGAYGHWVGKIFAFAYVKTEAAKPGTHLEVVIQGSRRAARVLGAPAYDPESLLPRTDTAMEPAQ